MDSYRHLRQQIETAFKRFEIILFTNLLAITWNEKIICFTIYQ